MFGATPENGYFLVLAVRSSPHTLLGMKLHRLGLVLIAALLAVGCPKSEESGKADEKEEKSDKKKDKDKGDDDDDKGDDDKGKSKKKKKSDDKGDDKGGDDKAEAPKKKEPPVPDPVIERTKAP